MSAMPPIATESMRWGELTRWANCGLMHRSKQVHGRPRFYTRSPRRRAGSVAGKDLPHESPRERQGLAVIHVRPPADCGHDLAGRPDAWRRFIAAHSHASFGIGTLGAPQIRTTCCGSALLLMAVLQP